MNASATTPFYWQQMSKRDSNCDSHRDSYGGAFKFTRMELSCEWMGWRPRWDSTWTATALIGT